MKAAPKNPALLLLLSGLLACVPLGLTTGCATSGISFREKVLGHPKREQLVNRVEDARDEQEQAKEQFATTLAEFKSLTGFDGGDLEKTYDKLKRAYERSESQAEDVSSRIDSVDRVAEALFSEWEDELDQYSTKSLRKASEQQLDDTKDRYEDLIKAMRAAEERMEPVLNAFNDQVLFLKHNLNARAIASLDQTVIELEDDIDRLIAEMNASIAEANAFIEEMGKPE